MGLDWQFSICSEHQKYAASYISESSMEVSKSISTLTTYNKVFLCYYPQQYQWQSHDIPSFHFRVAEISLNIQKTCPFLIPAKDYKISCAVSKTDSYNMQCSC
jgi:hypothetical protein